MNGERENDNQTPHSREKRIQELKGILAVLGSIYAGVAVFSYSRWDNALFTFSNAPVRNYGGIVGAYISDIIMSLIGLAGYTVPFFMLAYGIKRILDRPKNIMQCSGAFVFLSASAVFAQLLCKSLNLKIDEAGGIIGVLIARLLESLLSVIGAYIVSIALLIVSVFMVSPVSPIAFFMNKKAKEISEPEPDDPSATMANVPASDLSTNGLLIPEHIFAPEPLIVPEDLAEEQPEPVREPKKRQRSRVLAIQNEPVESTADDAAEGYILPSLNLLNDGEGTAPPSRDEMNSAASGLEKKLLDFKVEGKIKQAHPGPVVTMYEFEPAAGVKISRIISLTDDLALSLRAPSIRVYPISGKAAIGLEVPNKQRATVSFKEIIASDSFRKSSSLLTLALGKDIFGNPMVTDLARMPHLLVAGATGSGKSVSVNAMIMSLLYKASPDEVKMLMIDPKLLELSTYADIPHLISPVITSPKEASEALKKVVFEMERRYKLLAEKGTRNIETYNKLAEEGERLPFIVVIIDELADLMFTAPSDVETAIARLAQMARASGIHLILATQRPSVDVITGLIKANFPARISFQVTSRIDSRTILDSQGAEKLLGMGDMLFMIPGVKIVRIHGAYVSETEVKDVVNVVKAQGRPEYTAFQSIVLNEGGDGEGDAEGRDELYEKAVEFAGSVGEISISSIQRRFKIGYNRAANIMEEFERDGLVGPHKGAGKPRDFLGRR
ncbi:MAG: DNA translocase FtsK 4TM domain-containing protein [Nitrospirae bacterium]|nr:DNA translocase FtsK 4TM domain-containing protein [Nitrospirota bacterium]